MYPFEGNYEMKNSNVQYIFSSMRLSEDVAAQQRHENEMQTTTFQNRNLVAVHRCCIHFNQ